MSIRGTESPSLPNVSFQVAYRTTCDNCANSKVRCSKDHPSCLRCLGQGVTCAYSLSRRLKKVVDFREGIQQQATSNGAPKRSNIRSSHSGNEYDFLRNDCTSGSSASSSVTDQFYPSPWSFLDNDSDMQAPLTGMEELEDVEQSTGAFTALHEPLQDTMNSWPTQHWPHSMESSTGQSLAPMSPNTSVDFLSSLCNSARDNTSSTYDPHYGSSSASVMDHMENSNNKPSCAWIAASVLQSLESPGAAFKQNSQPSSATQGKTRRNLDTVISTNKSVIQIVHRISRCTCSAPSNHLVMISSVLFIVLAWYEACLNACEHASEQAVRRAVSENQGVRGKRHQTTDFFGEEGETAIYNENYTYDRAELVYIPPIQVGSLQLGMESKRQVVAQIVLTELAKVTKVMENVIEKSSSVSFMNFDGSGYQDLEAQLQYSLQVALQMRIEKISQAAEKAAK